MHTSAVPNTASILKLAWPLTLKAMMLHGIIVIDAYLVAALGEEAVAAMGLAGSFAGLVLGIIMAFSNATQIRIAQAFGSGSDVALKTGLYIGLLINIVAASFGALLLVLFGGDLIGYFAHTPWIAAEAEKYLMVFLLVFAFEMFGQCLGSYFNGCGKTVVPFLSYLIAIPLNIIVSYAFIHGAFGFPELGVMGAALGSAIASMMRLLFMAVQLYRKNRAYLDVAGWKNGTFLVSLKRHLKFALPIAATFVSVVVANNVAVMLYAKMSVNQFAAMTLIHPWIQVLGTFGISWAMATGIMVAQLLGKDQRGPELDLFLKRAWIGAMSAAGIVALCYLTLTLLSDQIYGNLQDETRAALYSFLPILLILPFPKGSNAMCGHSLRAGGDTVYVMNIFISSQWLCRLPLTAFVIFYLEGAAVWVLVAVLAEELFKFPLFHRRFLKGRWKEGLAEEETA